MGQLGCFTFDNATNNGTLMGSMEAFLKKQKIPFSKDGNRIRYVC